MRKWPFVLVVVLGLGAGVVVQNLNAPTPAGATTDPDRFSGFELPDDTGALHHTDRWRGKVLLINYWATWCPPCRREIPLFSRTQRKLGDRGLQIVGVAIDEPRTVREYRAGVDFTYPSLIAGPAGSALMRAQGNPTGVLPFSIVVDRKGRIVARKTGPFEETELENQLLPLL